MRGGENVSPQKIKNAPGVPSTEGITQISGSKKGSTQFGEICTIIIAQALHKIKIKEE